MENNKIGLHHSFDADLAVELKSTDLAILVHHFQYWIRHNAVTGRNLHKNRTWMYQTIKDIAAHFPYWSHKQVERLIVKLVDLGVLIKGNFNNSPYDRTVWYAFKNEEKFNISRNREMDKSKSGNQNPEIGTPIPDTITYAKTKQETPPIPQKGEATNAASESFSSSSEIPQEAKQLVDRFVQEIKEFKPDYVPPKKRVSWLVSAKNMLHDDKRDAEKVIKVLKWALCDNEVRGDWNGWSSKIIISKNPIAYLREKYDALEVQANAKKKRGFLPSSNQEEAVRMAEEMFRSGELKNV